MGLGFWVVNWWMTGNDEWMDREQRASVPAAAGGGSSRQEGRKATRQHSRVENWTGWRAPVFASISYNYTQLLENRDAFYYFI
jgi:hypothetical protein